jgi:hypothetical protein
MTIKMQLAIQKPQIMSCIQQTLKCETGSVDLMMYKRSSMKTMKRKRKGKR